MKTTRTLSTLFTLSYLLFQSLTAQNNTIMASAFKENGEVPPFEVGKNFHINYPGKPLRSCFTAASADKSKLQASGARKTSVNVYYAGNTEKLNQLKSNGFSAKIGFFNFAKAGYSKKETSINQTSNNEEYLVVIAKVDFGRYNFKEDLDLKPECKKLIDDALYDEFIKTYGTHYISGIKKESELRLILKASKHTRYIEDDYIDAINGGFTFKGLGPSAEVTNQTDVNTFLNSFEFNVDLEMEGGNIEKGDLLNATLDVLKDNNKTDKINEIKKILLNSLSAINNDAEAAITQFYYAPLENYHLNGVNWNDAKEQELIKLNKSLLLTEELHSKLQNFTSPDALQKWSITFDEELKDFKNKDSYKNKFIKEFNAQLPELKKLNAMNDYLRQDLIIRHSKCADIGCEIETSKCCTYNSSNAELLNANTGKIISKLEKIFNDASNEATKELIAQIQEELTPECEKKKMATLQVINKSSNPYNFYEGDTFIKTLQGGEIVSFNIELGQHYYTASQNSGYAFYPTVNKRQVSAIKVCEEITIKVGFED